MSTHHGSRRVSRRRFLGAGLATGAFLAGWPPREGTLAATLPGGAPTRGGTLLGAQEVDPISLDPHTNSNLSALQGYEHAYEGLTSYDEKMNVVPALATRWEISPDGMTYTFHLREGVRFHNGQAMTADDVQYSINRVLDPKTASPFQNVFAVIKDVRVIDPLTVQLTLTEPYYGLLSEFASLRASGVVPRGIAERENLKVQAVGTGPFKLVEYVPQDHLTYARFDQYWDRPLPYLDGLQFKVLTEEAARLSGLRSGQLQYAVLSPEGVRQVGRTGAVVVLQSPFAWAAAHRINVSKKPLDDARVRRALRMAVDTRDVIRKSVFGAGIPTGPLPTGFDGWALAPETLPYQKPDLDAARRLLAEAGHPGGGFTVTINCSPQYPEFVASSLVLQDAVRAIGVTVNVQQMEWGAFLKVGLDFDLAATAWTFRADPDGYLYPFFHSTGVLNAGPYRNPHLDAVLDQARTTAHHAERIELYDQAQRTLLADAVTYWYYTKFNIEALSARVHGYTQSFSGRRMFLKQSWLA